MRRTPSDPFARKPIAMLIGEMQGDERLHRVLGPLALTSLGVGATIGTGIYVLTGEVAHDYAGPSLMLSFLLAAVGCGFAALCYSELASMVPVAGSAYTYAYATLGELVAWIIGWDLVLEYAIGSAAVANGWSNYFVELVQRVFGFRIDPRLLDSPLGLRPVAGGVLPQDRDARLGRGRPGVVQPAGGPDHGVHHRPPGGRDQGERGVQRGDGPAQRGGHPRDHRRGGGLRRPRELAAVPARGEGVEGRGRGGRADLLRLHRLRLDLDALGGGPQPAARPGDRHPQLAPDLHRALRRRGGRPDRDDPLSPDRRRAPRWPRRSARRD